MAICKLCIVSTGLRFTTLPDPEPLTTSEPPASSSSSTTASQSSPSSSSTSQNSAPFQPPTTLTALFNPIIGHISTSYVAQVSRDLALCSRFDFNVYSYESEWCLGAEWWIRRGMGGSVTKGKSGEGLTVERREDEIARKDEVQGVIKARASTNSVRFFFLFLHIHPSL